MTGHLDLCNWPVKLGLSVNALTRERDLECVLSGARFGRVRVQAVCSCTLPRSHAGTGEHLGGCLYRANCDAMREGGTPLPRSNLGVKISEKRTVEASFMATFWDS